MHKHLTIGILGGGQLARMSALAASRLGIATAILEREKCSPAGQLTHLEYVGWVDDESLVRQFVRSCDVVTLENEFIDYRRLEFIESLGKRVLPSSGVIALIQDKFIQKETLAQHGIPVPLFRKVTHDTTLKQLSSQLGSTVVMKSRKMGYDGYGNALVRSARSFAEATAKLSTRHTQLMAEEFINFRMELAVMVVRTKKETRAYPVVQTIQKNHICSTVIAPAPIDRKMAARAAQIAIAAVEAVGGYGLFGVELFITDRDEILVNEMAPRPHNSGHYTIEGCVTSQFENHVRAVLGLPLGPTTMTAPYAVMVNLLGSKKPRAGTANLTLALQNERAHFHLYGKAASRPGRKMGHVTFLGRSLPELLAEAERLQKGIRL
ncbi:MAG TPA: 5-(carboxyamino)imidazole ribonucleotide synthase [Bacteroidota bacterium]|nr:5-(carboxyamino)imidazole ribonucleotide synthase [Bacteroidota bacterium]